MQHRWRGTVGQQAVEVGQEWVWQVEEGEGTTREDWGMGGGTKVASSYREGFYEPPSLIRVHAQGWEKGRNFRFRHSQKPYPSICLLI